MKLNAKARLQATQVIAAKGDAAHLRKALSESVDLFSNACSHTAGGDSKGAAKQLQMAMKSIAAAAKKTFGSSIDYIAPSVNADKSRRGTPAILGGVQIWLKSPEGKGYSFSWEFNIHEDNPDQASCWVALDEKEYFEYKFNTSKGFDSNKCLNVMNKAMNYFESKGFSK